MKPTGPIKRVLVREANWLGDIVMSLPALHAIRRAYPDAHLAVLIKKELAGFLAGSAWIDEVIGFKVRKGLLAGWSDRRALAAQLREKRFDQAVLFPNSFDSALLTRMAGIPRRAGFNRYSRGWLLTQTVRPSTEILETHQVHYYLNLLERTLEIGGSPADFVPDVSAPAAARMRELLSARRKRPEKRLIALAVAAAYGPAKEWPAAHFGRLIDRLAEEHGAECVLIGSSNERVKSEQAAALSKSGALVAAGETDVAEALALLSLCDGFAGNDSGSMHVAGALGKPTVGIYGSTRADRTGPLGPRTRTLYKQIACSPCLKRTCRFGHYDCLHAIAPEEVLAALRELGAV